MLTWSSHKKGFRTKFNTVEAYACVQQRKQSTWRIFLSIPRPGATVTIDEKIKAFDKEDAIHHGMLLIIDELNKRLPTSKPESVEDINKVIEELTNTLQEMDVNSKGDVSLNDGSHEEDDCGVNDASELAVSAPDSEDEAQKTDVSDEVKNPECDSKDNLKTNEHSNGIYLIKNGKIEWEGPLSENCFKEKKVSKQNSLPSHPDETDNDPKVLILIAGPSGSGKSTLAKGLEKYGYKKVVTYTTRPMRKGEKEGVDYYFLSDPEFALKKKDGCFLETGYYNGWNYGTGKDKIAGSCTLVLTPSGIRRAKREYPNSIVVYINPGRKVCFKRLLDRGDNIDESYRRNVSDQGQFDGFEDEADLVIEGDIPEQEVLSKTINFIQNLDVKAMNKNANIESKIDAIYKYIAG